MTLDAVPKAVRSWSHARWFDLGHGIKRRGAMIRVPDQQLLPTFFAARSVVFYAGLEVGLMHHGLMAWSWLRGRFGIGQPRWLARVVRFLAGLLGWAGTDVGGMSVAVVVRGETGWERRRWRMIARRGEGPYIPGIAARTALRLILDIPPGARPALATFQLDKVLASMDDLAVTTEIDRSPIVPIFEQVLGDNFADLPTKVRDSHETVGPRLWQGIASVRRGQGIAARLMAATFGFPPAGVDIPVSVLKLPQDGVETWERRFGDKVYRSILRATPDGMTEAFGPFNFALGLHVAADALHFPVRKGWFLGIPIPTLFLPKSVSREYAKDGLFHFDVALFAPLTRHLVVHYRGHLERDAE